MNIKNTRDIFRFIRKYKLDDYIEWSQVARNKIFSLKYIMKYELYRITENDCEGNIYISISNNPNITIDFVKENLNWSWNWKSLSRHPNINMDDIDNNFDLPWNWEHISNNPNLNEKFIKKHCDRPFRWYKLSLIANLDINSFINIKAPWPWDIIFREKHIPFEVIDKNKTIYWNWRLLTVNHNYTLQDIENNIDRPWKWSVMSDRKDLTFEFIDKHIHKFKNYTSLSSKINYEILIKYPDKPWDWVNISLNQNFGIEHVEKHPEFPWCWNEFSSNKNILKNITLKFLEKNIDKNFYWFAFRTLKNVFTIDFIEKYHHIHGLNGIYDDDINVIINKDNYKDKRTLKYLSTDNFKLKYLKYHGKNAYYNESSKQNIYCKLSYNPNLTFEFITRHMHKNWDWSFILGEEKFLTEIITNIHYYKHFDYRRFIETFSYNINWFVFTNTLINLIILKNNIKYYTNLIYKTCN